MPIRRKLPSLFDGHKQNLVAESDKLLFTHEAFLGIPHKINNIIEIGMGDVIHFMYAGSDRVVLVLNPNYHMQLHGLTLRKVDHRTLMAEVISRMLPTDTPAAFYKRVINRPALIKTDSYRTYDIRQITDIQRMEYAVTEKGREELNENDKSV